VVALIPLARTPAWSTGITEMLRQTIMTDPEWKGGQYVSQPERAMRLSSANRCSCILCDAIGARS